MLQQIIAPERREVFDLVESIEFVSNAFSFSNLVTASLTLFFKDNSEINDWFLISSFTLFNSLFSELILLVA